MWVDIKQWSLHRTRKRPDSESSHDHRNFSCRQDQVCQRYSEHQRANIGEHRTGGRPGSYWRYSAIHCHCERHFKHRRLLECGRRWLQWSSMRLHLFQWPVLRSSCRSKASTCLRDGNFSGRCHQVEHCRSYNHSADCRESLAFDGDGNRGKSTAVCRYSQRQYKHQHPLEPERQRLQWSILRCPIFRGSLHRACIGAGPCASDY